MAALADTDVECVDIPTRTLDAEMVECVARCSQDVDDSLDRITTKLAEAEKVFEIVIFEQKLTQTLFEASHSLRQMQVQVQGQGHVQGGRSPHDAVCILSPLPALLYFDVSIDLNMHFSNGG